MIIWHDLDHRDVILQVDPPAQPGCPVDNLLNPDRGSVCRIYNDTIVITGLYLYRRWLNAIGLVRHYCTTAAKWRLTVYGDDHLTDITYANDFDYMLPVKPLGELILGLDWLGASVYDQWDARISTMLFDPVPCFGWRLEIIDNGIDRIQASRLIAGIGWQSAYQPGWGASMAWSDDGKSSRTEAGSSRTDAIEPYRKQAINLEVLGSDDRSTLLDLSRRLGSTEDFIVSLYPEAAPEDLQRDGLLHAHFTQPPGLSHTAWQTWTSALNLEEL